MATTKSTGERSESRLAELLATLSLATDLANGFEPEKALRTCLLAVGLGRALGLNGPDLSDVYHLSLLRSVTSTCFAPEEAAAVGGDDVALRHAFATAEDESISLVRRAVTRMLGARGEATGGESEAILLRAGRHLMMEKCIADADVGTRLASRLGMSTIVARGTGQLNERWDGKGLPTGLAGEQIPLVVRIVQLADVVEIHHRSNGRQAAGAVARRRRGHQCDPDVVDGFLIRAEELLNPLEGSSVWNAVMLAEPQPRRRIAAAGLVDVARAFADFTDLKSTYTLGHSSGVAALAQAAGRLAGLDDRDVEVVHLAGLLHDLGRVSVPNGIWGKTGPLTPAEWERVRLHSYYTERVLASSPLLEPVARLASMHHERLDGSGYHRGAPAAVLDTRARVLAAADAYHACTERRPHRPALSPPDATRAISTEAAAGRLDREAVRWVLEAAGGRVERVRRAWPGGLTDREVDVLRLIAQGHTNAEVAQQLSISSPTVKVHILHIYSKLGVSSRAGAALFAVENDLIHR